MLRDGKDIELEAGQPIIVEAVGDRYTEFQGYKDDKETRIGLSYDKLCQSVKEGNRLLLADGSISIRVEEILSKTELRGTVLNSKKLGQRKVCLGGCPQVCRTVCTFGCAVAVCRTATCPASRWTSLC